MGEGSGFGKVILFGEHFVVYGLPAIASAVGAKTTASVNKKEGAGISLVDERPETPGYKKKKFGQQQDSFKRMFKEMGINTDEQGIDLKLAGDLIAMSGTGASAASCAAIARATSEEFGLGYDDERVNEIAYEGEKGYHGTPSGVDNTAATFGGVVWFVKGSPGVIEKLKLKEPVEIVMGDSGKVADTIEVVGSVREQKEKEPEKYEKIFERMKELVVEAREALEAGDWEKVGKLMDENHELLQQIDVSCEELDLMVKTARENGAIGAKMTGTGRGGIMFALTPGKELQEKVAKAIEEKGFKVIKTTIGTKQ